MERDTSAGSGQNHGDVPREVLQGLAACTAGRCQAARIADDGNGREFPRPLRKGLEEGGALGAHREAQGVHFYVDAREHSPVGGKKGGADPEFRKGRVRVPPGLAGEGDQIFMVHTRFQVLENIDRQGWRINPICDILVPLRSILYIGSCYRMARSLLNSVLSRWKKLLLVAGAGLVFFLLFNYVLMPTYVNHGSRLTVPNVEGMSVEGARQVLEGASLVAVEAGVRPEPGQPVGTIVDQNPPPGAVVKEGRRVYLTLSGGEVLVNVPGLRGKSLRDAKFSLERQGLKVGGITYASSDTYPQNTIIEQALPEDRRVPRGTTVGLTVSQGRATSETTVPMVEGKTLAEAQRLLEGAGLVLGTVSRQVSADLLPNTVIDQVPAAGTSLQLGQPVDLLVVQAGMPAEEISRPRE